MKLSDGMVSLIFDDLISVLSSVHHEKRNRVYRWVYYSKLFKIYFNMLVASSEPVFAELEIPIRWKFVQYNDISSLDPYIGN